MKLTHYFLDGKIVDVAPNTLKPSPENPRVAARLADPEKFEGLKASIQGGFFEPLLVEGSTLEIVAGHQRVDAARELGLPTVPVIFLKDLDETTKTRIRISANGHAGAFDLPKLRLQLETLSMTDLPMLGLDAMTMENVAPTPPADSENSAAGEENEKWRTLKFKMTTAVADRVEEIIEDFCKKQKCRPGTALERIVEEWSLDPNNSLEAA